MPTALTRSDAHALLANRRRRLALHILRASDQPLTVSTLAERVAERTDGPASATTVENVSAALHHCHLPQLGDADVVAFDWVEGTVVRGPNFDDLLRVDATVADRGTP